MFDLKLIFSGATGIPLAEWCCEEYAVQYKMDFLGREEHMEELHSINRAKRALAFSKSPTRARNAEMNKRNRFNQSAPRNNLTPHHCLFLSTSTFSLPKTPPSPLSPTNLHKHHK